MGFPNGSANLLLIAENEMITVFVDEELVDTRQVDVENSGDLNFAIMAGDHRGFGTRCVFSNIEIWRIR